MQGREGWEVVAQGACSTPCLPACLPACLLACTNPCLPACLPACWCAQLLCAAACLLLAPSPARSGAPHLRLHQQQRAAAAEPVQRSPGGAPPAPACTVSEALPACMPGLSAIGWQEARGSRPAGAAPVRLPLPCPAALPWPPLPACLQTLVPSASPSPTVMPNTSPSMPWSNISPAAQVGAHACLLHPTSSRSCSRSRSSLDCRHSCGTL